jgi:hypothetical protein
MLLFFLGTFIEFVFIIMEYKLSQFLINFVMFILGKLVQLLACYMNAVNAIRVAN